MKKLTLLSLITLLSISTYSQSLYWEKTGNTGNTESDFIGTTDFKPVIIKSNNEAKVCITPMGKIAFGTTSPNANLHLHRESNALSVDPDAGTTDPTFDGGSTSGGKVKDTTSDAGIPPGEIIYPTSPLSGDYTNSFLMTNKLTGSGANNGFKILQSNTRVTLKQQENAMLHMLGMNDKGLSIAPNGNITIGLNSLSFSNLNYNLLVDGTLFSKTIISPRVILKDTTAIGWNCILQINASGNQTKCVSINNPDDEEVFRVYGNGVTYSKYLVSEQIKVDLEAINIQWYDHVFSSEYELMSIQDVEKFVRENHHLPDIPSEKEIRENGLNLAEMDALLLKKIEEMMLYIIELEKRIKDFENEKIK